MGRRSKSEYERRDQLREKGWFVILAPASLGPADLIAIRRWGIGSSSKELYELRVEQIKETRKDVLYLTHKEVEELKNCVLPVDLVVKFKVHGFGKPVWKTVKPRTVVRKFESRKE